MIQFKAGDLIDALIPMRSGSYWASGQLSIVEMPQGQRFVFNGFDRGGFPISLGVELHQLRRAQ